MKKCSICKKTKSILDFNKNKSRKDGIQSSCRPCDQNRAKTRYYQVPGEKDKARDRARQYRYNALQYVYDFLLANGCMVCKERDPVVLDFDHLNPKEKFKNVSTLVSEGYSLQTIKKEIDKCQILCSNCHRRKNAKEYGWYKVLGLEQVW